jgi:hypothetical protein
MTKDRERVGGTECVCLREGKLLRFFSQRVGGRKCVCESGWEEVCV